MKPSTGKRTNRTKKPRHATDCTCIFCREWRRVNERRTTLMKTQQRLYEKERQLIKLREDVVELHRGLKNLSTENARLKRLAEPRTPTDEPGDDQLADRPLTAEAPLTLFYARYFRVARLDDARPCTIEKYDGVLACWARLTGDPPMGQITVQTLLRFREALKASRGKQPGSVMSVNSVRSILVHLQAVLDNAGPAGHRNRDCAGILPAPVPWVRRPRPVEKTPRMLTADTLRAVYAAAEKMTEPQVSGVLSATWWRSLLILAHNTMLRRRSLFELQWTDVDWSNLCLRMPPERMKSERCQTIHLNGAALSALKDISGDRELVFPGFKHKKDFYNCLHQLLDLAGLKRSAHFGLHAIRANSAGILWETSPQVAQFILGHQSLQTTKTHYVNGKSMVNEALDDMPQFWKDKPS